eukprot:TRINITY_DN11078_c0_g1_i1.p1 TRINITY_DN11078_c0_g1~~TRINITY_DN11078_c0_g1_i1.p1  ORF type:complete len:342 (+),score=54.11 TRINITY_DN11078_c0_g1_i1:108-1133(+)
MHRLKQGPIKADSLGWNDLWQVPSEGSKANPMLFSDSPVQPRAQHIDEGKSTQTSVKLDLQQGEVEGDVEALTKGITDDNFGTTETISEDFDSNLKNQAKQMYEALYDFEGSQEGDLSFHAGDVIEVTKNSGNWWNGNVAGNDASGTFPSNYVRVFDKYTSRSSVDGWILPVEEKGIRSEKLNLLEAGATLVETNSNVNEPSEITAQEGSSQEVNVQGQSTHNGMAEKVENKGESEHALDSDPVPKKRRRFRRKNRQQNEKQKKRKFRTIFHKIKPRRSKTPRGTRTQTSPPRPNVSAPKMVRRNTVSGGANIEEIIPRVRNKIGMISYRSEENLNSTVQK